MVAAVLIALSTSPNRRVAVAVASTFVLLVLGSRSEFVAFFIIVGMLMVFLGIRDVRYVVWMLIGLSAMVLVFLGAGEWLESSRQSTIAEFDELRGWHKRIQTIEVAAGQVASSPVFGQWGGHISHWGGTGSYAHNALSAWVQFGLIGFLLYIGLTIKASLACVGRVVFWGERSPIWLLALIVNCVTLFLMTITKSVFWELPPLGWGLYVQAQSAYVCQDAGSRQRGDSVNRRSNEKRGKAPA